MSQDGEKLDYLTIIPSSPAYVRFRPFCIVRYGEDEEEYWEPQSFEYSLDDGNTWFKVHSYEVDVDYRYVTIFVDKSVKFGAKFEYDDDWYDGNVGFLPPRISVDTSFDVEGSVMSLMYNNEISKYTGALSIPLSEMFANSTLRKINTPKTFLPARTALPDMLNTSSAPYSYMFCDCYELENAPDIYLERSGVAGFSDMFNNCQSLTKGPKIYTEIFDAFGADSMFNGCSEMTEPPELIAENPTIGDWGMRYMFRNCIRLKTAPRLSSTQLSPSCYAYMFFDCRTLGTAPELPATTLADGCYENMFQKCRSLMEGPSVLPATDAKPYCYLDMFKECINLEIAPEIHLSSATKSYCCQDMFFSCGALTYVKTHILTAGYSSMNGWLDGIDTTGKLLVPSGSILNEEEFLDLLPEYWTIETF